MAMPTLPDTGLTVKQEAFCQCIFQGMSQRAAYLQSYDAQDMAIESIDVTASRLMDNSKVTLRLKQLQALAEAQAGLSMAEKRGVCKSIALNEEFRPRDRLVAVDIDNKQMRVYADAPPQSTSYTLNVIVDSPQTKGLIDRLLAGGGRPDGQPPLALDTPPTTTDDEPSST
jgi:hypothetical protein